MAKRAVPDYELKSVWFSDAERKEYEAWIEGNRTDVLDLLLDVQENGFKFSISSDGNSGAPLISISIKPGRKMRKGQVLMYRHNDLEKCIRIAYYHFVIVTRYGAEQEITDSSLDW